MSLTANPSEKTPSAPLGRQFVTVSQLTAKVKGLLETDIGEVWVKGEISGFKPSASGHFYFSLKDEGAVVNCAMFRGAAQKIAANAKFKLHDGLEVLMHGRISVYAPRGNYQLIVDHVEPVGHGALQLAFEQLKARLDKEGLFAMERKRPIPAYPSKIAIVTSPTGAALQDMLNILGRRNSGISILVVPTLVQGDDAPPQIAKAIELVNRHGLAEVIVVARGGGSLEDLWSFNDERVVRAVHASAIPVISAVGHEVDFTLCDFASDLRAPTPSAAAELVSKNKIELLEGILTAQRRLVVAMTARISRSKTGVLALENRLVGPGEKFIRLRKALEELRLRMEHAMDNVFPFYRQALDDFQSKISRSVEKRVEERRRAFETLAGRLEALSPLKVLGRGYTLIEATSSAGSSRLIKSVHDAKKDQEVSILFHDGKIPAKIL